MRAMKKAAMKRRAMKAAAPAAPKAMRVMKKAAMKRTMKAAAPKAMRAMKKAAMKRAMKAAAPAAPKAMRVMKKAAMKRRAMKAAAPAAPKAMRAMKKKPISARAAKHRVFKGLLVKTISGLTKSDYMVNKRGKVVSKKNHALGLKRPWMVAVVAARKALNITGLAMVKKGTPLYKKAKEFMAARK